MAKYRKKPIVTEAIQWRGDNFDDLTDFMHDIYFYPCKPDVFEATYERVDDEPK